jgi:hypothetical protein
MYTTGPAKTNPDHSSESSSALDEADLEIEPASVLNGEHNTHAKAALRTHTAEPTEVAPAKEPNDATPPKTLDEYAKAILEAHQNVEQADACPRKVEGMQSPPPSKPENT